MVPFESGRIPETTTDCLVIGSGIAGLRAAIEVGQTAKVTVITKRSITESNTANAQGGVAVVLDTKAGDDMKLHMADTVKVGCGLNDQDAVEKVIRQGPGRVQELIDWGARFDSAKGELELDQPLPVLFHGSIPFGNYEYSFQVTTPDDRYVLHFSGGQFVLPGLGAALMRVTDAQGEELGRFAFGLEE